MQQRIKVVNEISDLVPVLRAVDSPLKLQLFQRLTETWLTLQDIEGEFGKEGVKVLGFFEKLKLVDSRWVSREGRKTPDKSFHSYYSTVNINTTAPLSEISEILSVASMAEKDYGRLEKQIYDCIGDQGRFFSDVAEELKMSATRLKGLIKRSEKLEFRGHRIERLNGAND